VLQNELTDPVKEEAKTRAYGASKGWNVKSRPARPIARNGVILAQDRKAAQAQNLGVQAGLRQPARQNSGSKKVMKEMEEKGTPGSGPQNN
jgi:hypothetical protein